MAAGPRLERPKPCVRNSVNLKRRKKQAILHDKVWNVLEWLIQEPEGTRMNCMAERAADIFLVFQQNPISGAMTPDIETATKLTPLVDAAWAAISNNSSRSNMYRWRRLAGLPYRRLR